MNLRIVVAIAAVLAALALPAATPAHGWNVSTASWYGAELYGNRTACGQVYSGRVWGVAHKRYACGTRLTFRYRGRVARLTVVDRGPFVHGREFDLTAAVAGYLRFSGVHRIQWRRGW